RSSRNRGWLHRSMTRSARSRGDKPRRSACPCSVTRTSTSCRGMSGLERSGTIREYRSPAAVDAIATTTSRAARVKSWEPPTPLWAFRPDVRRAEWQDLHECSGKRACPELQGEPAAPFVAGQFLGEALGDAFRYAEIRRSRSAVRRGRHVLPVRSNDRGDFRCRHSD